MYRSIAALLLALAATGAPWAQAPDADPLSSSVCLAAREELDKALGEAASGRPARSERLARARRQAAAACLGRDSGSRERSGAPQPAQAVPPALPPAPAAQPPLPAIAPAPPPVAVPRAAVITTCDPAGCWDSEGRRLNDMGPLLMGPRGLCMLQGGVLTCP